MPSAVSGTRSRLTVLMLMVAAAYFVLAFGQQAIHNRQLRLRVDQLRQQNSDAQALNRELQVQLDSYQAGGNVLYSEIKARDDLGMARPGDVVIVPMLAGGGDQNAEAPVGTTGPAAGGVEPGVQPNWQRWFNLVLHGT